jgi:hypothetical protein
MSSLSPHRSWSADGQRSYHSAYWEVFARSSESGFEPRPTSCEICGTHFASPFRPARHLGLRHSNPEILGIRVATVLISSSASYGRACTIPAGHGRASGPPRGWLPSNTTATRGLFVSAVCRMRVVARNGWDAWFTRVGDFWRTASPSGRLLVQ